MSSKPRPEELARARNTLVKAAAEIGAWPERKNDTIFQKALLDIRDHPDVEKIVAQFGNQIPLMQPFVERAEIDAAELAVKIMMHTTASVVADLRCQPVSAKAVHEKREELEKRRDYALSLTPDDDRNILRVDYGRNKRLRDDYVSWINSYLATLVSLDDPLVEQRPPTRAKELEEGAADPAHARAVWARVQEEARRMFGRTGDRVTDVFVSAGTNVPFSRNDRRKRSRR
jgi:hypothetical protein